MFRLPRLKIEVKNTEIRYLPVLSIFNLLSVYVLVQKNLNYYPNYPTHRLYFGEVETPYLVLEVVLMFRMDINV